MDKKALDRFHRRLLNLRDEITKIISSEEDSSSQNISIDEIDQATDLIEKEMGFAMSSNFRTNLKRVEEALRRIDNGTYGRCVNCNRDIPLKRLEILPFTQYCIDCQREVELER